MCVIFFSLHRFVVNGCNLPGFWDEIRCFYFQEFLKISEKNRQNISKILQYVTLPHRIRVNCEGVKYFYHASKDNNSHLPTNWLN